MPGTGPASHRGLGGEVRGVLPHSGPQHFGGSSGRGGVCQRRLSGGVERGAQRTPPRSLLAYLAKVTRNIALKRLEHNQAQKRGDRFYLLLDELAEVLPGEDSVEDAVAQRELMEAINDFLKTKTDRGERQLFLRRYFWGDSIGELTVLFRHSESKVKSQLFRTRQRLRGYLEERGLLG